MRRSTPTLVLFVAFAVLTSESGVQQGRKLTLEDYYALNSVGSPGISPDGEWVTYTVSTRVASDNGTAVESWLVPVDGSGAPAR